MSAQQQRGRFEAPALIRFAADVFAAHGVADPDAHTAAHALVEADRRGVWSHGLARLSMYCGRLAAGSATARPRIAIDRVAPAAVQVDGDDGLGLIVAPRAMDAAIACAREAGIGVAGVRRSGHFGMAGLYSDQAVAAGMVGMVFTNASPALPPHGAMAPFLGTSPLAVAIPAGDAAPFSLDMAMSHLARGKLKFAAQRGEPIPPGLALDRHGRPTTDGAEAFEGVVLPFGGVKGAGLSWMMDALAGVLTGAAFGGDVANPFTGTDRPQGTGHLFIALRADLFLPLAEVRARMDELARRARALPKADGVEEILSPGEREIRRAAQSDALGVSLTEDVVADLRAVGAKAGVAWPFTNGADG